MKNACSGATTGLGSQLPGVGVSEVAVASVGGAASGVGPSDVAVSLTALDVSCSVLDVESVEHANIDMPRHRINHQVVLELDRMAPPVLHRSLRPCRFRCNMTSAEWVRWRP